METHGLCYLFVATVPRFYLPVKPCLTCANLGGADGFAELGTRFKAAHVKRIIWWLARETQEFADSNPQVPRADLFTQTSGEENLPGSSFQHVANPKAIRTFPNTTKSYRMLYGSWFYLVTNNFTHQDIFWENQIICLYLYLYWFNHIDPTCQPRTQF